MKKEEKQMILIIVIAVILIIGIIWLITRGGNGNTDNQVAQNEIKENVVSEEFVQIIGDGTKLNTSTKLNEMKEFKGLKIGNIQLTNSENKTQLIANVTNETQADTQAMLIKVVLYDKSGNELARLAGRIPPVKVGQTIQFSTSAMIDYANAYDFKIIENK